MVSRSLIGAVAVMAMLIAASDVARAFDDAKYPDLRGQWLRARPPAGVTGQAPFDPDKSWGLAQQAPLTPEYQKVLEASLADQAAGGQGFWPSAKCLAVGMPAIMGPFQPMEFVVLPEATYVRIDHNRDTRRRIFTDGRDWPANVQPTFHGYSIGRWLDTTGNGRFDTLEAETRYFKGPRSFEPSGMPLHKDNQTIVKERIYLDKAKPDILHDEITLIDHAYTRPWTIIKNYPRYKNPGPTGWPEEVCAEAQVWVSLGKEDYFLSSDGYLMPTKKNQAPPDLRYFNRAEK